MRFTQIPSAALFTALLAASAGAQDTRGGMDQIGAADDAPVAQISSGSRRIEAPAAAEPRSTAAPQQLSSDAESAGASPQLTRERPSAVAGAQLNRSGRTAQPAEALSRPSEGRAGAGAVARIAGEDACDPRREGNSAGSRFCRRVIETRAAEFQKAEAAALSPEQRLLVDQQSRERMGLRAAARRLATDPDDADSMESQAIASIVLPDPVAPAKPQEPAAGEPSAAQAIVEAIIGSGSVTAPPPQ